MNSKNRNRSLRFDFLEGLPGLQGIKKPPEGEDSIRGFFYKKESAATYSPTQSPVQYHRR